MQAETVNIVRGRVAGAAVATRAGRGVFSPADALPVAVVLAIVLVQFFPAAQAMLQFDRHAVQDGQVWRVLTCHLTHWSWSHLAADLAAFVALCWLGRGRPYRLFAMLAASFAAVGLTVDFGAGDIAIYRGLSGVNYALLGWVLVTLVVEAGRLTRITCISLLVVVAVKIAFEVAGAGLIPGIGLPDGIATVGVAHAAGLIVGTLAGNKTRN